MSEAPTGPSAPIATGASLRLVAAIWNALWWRDADFYPRVAEGGVVSTLGTSPMLKEMEKASERWSKLENNDSLKDAIALAKQSLAEVKAQTEYQDQKATRLLTVTTFLSALSGALFSRFEDAYPVSTVLSQPNWITLLLISCYVIFSAFVILSLSGALVTFHAIRTRFKYPPTQNTEDQEKDPRSLLFYAPLIRSRPRAWINGWVTAGADGDFGERPMLRDDLQQRYFRDLVSETYLVAAKTADKVRYLQPAQSLLAASLRCLFFWLLFLAPTSIFAPSTKALIKPIEVTLVSASSPSPQSPAMSPAGQVPSPQPLSAPSTEPAKNGMPPSVAAPAHGSKDPHP